MITDLIMAFLMVIMLACMVAGAAWYAALPEVGINEFGECAWVSEKGVRAQCPTELPTKYIEIKVGEKS